MRSNTWARNLALAASLAALGLFSVACSKSSKEKETSSSQTKLNGTKNHTGSDTATKPGNPDNTSAIGTKPGHTDQANDKMAKRRGGGYKLLANKPEYTLKLVYPDSLASGASGTARVVLAAKTGWKLNKEYPTKLQIVSPDGASVDKAKQKRGDAVRWAEKSAEWQVKITVNAAGSKPFTGKFKFAVCTETTCDPKKELLAWVVKVP